MYQTYLLIFRNAFLPTLKLREFEYVHNSRIILYHLLLSVLALIIVFCSLESQVPLISLLPFSLFIFRSLKWIVALLVNIHYAIEKNPHPTLLQVSLELLKILLPRSHSR